MDTKSQDEHSEISTAIMRNRNLPEWFIRKSLSGTLLAEDVKTFSHYDNLFKLRHDFIHWYICQHRLIPFGEKRVFEIKELDNLRQYDHWDEVKNQSPDSVVVHGKTVDIMELTISSNRLANKEKITKYSLLIDGLRRCGFKVNLEVIVIPTLMNIPNRESLINEHKMNDLLVDNIYRVIENFNNIIHVVEMTPLGQEWHSRRNKETYDDVDLGITDDVIIKYFQSSEFKSFTSQKDLEEILDHKSQDDPLMPILSKDDNDFLDFVAEESLKMDSDLLKTESLDIALNDLYRFQNENKNSSEFRSFFPLPYFNSRVKDSSTRDTSKDEEELVNLKGLLASTTDPFLHKISEMKDLIYQVKLSDMEKREIALEGPGRKKYIAQNSRPHIEKQNKHKNFWFDIKTPNYDRHIETLSYQLSGLDDFDVKRCKFKGVGLNYVQGCQSIFREICINVMRSDRRHKFCLKPTGVQGIYLLLFPGPKLRTGENISIMWFKLFAMPEVMDYKMGNWCFKQWKNHGSFLESSWLSTDANRLDHYLRCYDRILMSYLTYINFDQESLSENIINDKTNVLGIIIMIYMEDKRSTSKMLQDGRYLVMGSLSKFRWWQSLLKKFHEPIRSPLQAYLLRKMMNYSVTADKNIQQIISNAQFGKVVGDEDSISDKLSGAIFSLPRLLTNGPDINFNQLLCEMYFTMLFNKNQDDPTHATFQILDKMLEGELSLSEVKNDSKLHMGGNNMYEDALTLIHKPHKNQFSKYALMIGSRLQSLSSFNKHPAGLSHRKAAQNKYLNKPLSEFATYKSSATFTTNVLDRSLLIERKLKSTFKDTLEEEFREYEDDNKLDMTRKQNPRRRCIEGIIQLLQEGKHHSFDVIQSTILNEMYFQVFKKNQIGGAREILILPIEKRITINILESFSRLICKDDSREMLTHGDMKLSMMRDIMREVRRTNDDGNRRLVLNFNLDKTRWGPSFMPIQFIYLFKPFAHHYPSLFRFLLLTLMVHTNKKCLIPEKLIKVWLNDPRDTIKHFSKDLQKLKESFLKTEKLYFDNESNMGQGILHYTSSYLHICALSFRDSIYERLCKKMNISPGVWKDLVSSDDSYTSLALPMDNIKKIKLRYTLFMRSQEVTERLFNIWTSKSKSSISFLISEFNSMFGSNLTLFPTTFKFGLSSVMPSNTDSFFRMVKESYNSCRQIVENGGSLELYKIAHTLNKKYCEQIYHTYKGGQNDFRKLGISGKNIPYQLGYYPIGDPAIMLILGPEFHNYDIVDRFHELDELEKRLFNNCHTMIPINNPDLYAELNSFDNIYTGLLRIEAAMGPVKQLQKIKRQVDMSWAEMNSLLEKDLLMTLREPKTIQEIKVHTYLKLFSYGASESLRDTASSIYYARVSASVSSDVFQIPYHDEYKANWVYDKEKKKKRMIGHTFFQCLSYLANATLESVDWTPFYPHMREYIDLKQLSSCALDYRMRNPLETQNLRSFQLSEVTMRIKNPIRDLLDAFWISQPNEKPTSFIRDWITLKELVPLIRDSVHETLDQIPGTQHNKIKIVLLLLMRIMGYSSKPMKAVTYGTSCRTYDATYLSLTQRCLYQNRTSEELVINENLENNPRIYDKLFFLNNVFILSVYNNNPVDLLNSLDSEVVEKYCRDTTISSASKKKMLIMLLYCGFIDNINEWTGCTKTIMHQWVERQRWNGSEYYGNFKLLVQCGGNKMLLERVGLRYNIKMSTASNPVLNKELFDACCTLVSLDTDYLLSKLQKGSFMITATRILSTNTQNGYWIDMQPLEDVKIIATDVTMKVDDDIRFLVLNGPYGQVMKTPFGLNATDYIPMNGEIPDLYVDTISIYDLAKIRIFSANFSFEHLRREDMLSVINDIEVRKPKISAVTKQRLQGLISNEWDTKTLKEEFTDADEKYAEEELDSFYDELITTEPDSKAWESINLDVDPIYDTIIDASSIIGLITAMPSKRLKYQPVQILERVLNCRYHIIARCCLDISIMSKSTIEHVMDITNSKHLIYSLIYMYDRLYSQTEAPSPPSHDTNLFNDFLIKFNLNKKRPYNID